MKTLTPEELSELSVAELEAHRKPFVDYAEEVYDKYVFKAGSRDAQKRVEESFLRMLDEVGVDNPARLGVLRVVLAAEDAEFLGAYKWQESKAKSKAEKDIADAALTFLDLGRDRTIDHYFGSAWSRAKWVEWLDREISVRAAS